MVHRHQLFLHPCDGRLDRRRQGDGGHGRRRGEPVPLLPEPARALRSGEGRGLYPPLHGRSVEPDQRPLSDRDDLSADQWHALAPGRPLPHAQISLGLHQQREHGARRPAGRLGHHRPAGRQDAALLGAGLFAGRDDLHPAQQERAGGRRLSRRPGLQPQGSGALRPHPVRHQGGRGRAPLRG